MNLKPSRHIFCLCTLLAMAFAFAVQSGLADTSVGGTISVDTTWTQAGSPYVVTSTITVQGTDGADGITTLTIEPGVTIKFYHGYLNIGAASGSPGALVAQGTAAQSIVFTSKQAAPAAGDWYGIRIYNTADDALTRLEHCEVNYAGFYSNPAIQITDAAPTLMNCTFTNCAYYDLKYTGTVGGMVSGCTINNGIHLQAASTVDFSGNTFNYNNARPIITYADNVHSLVNGNTFANLDSASAIKVTSGNVTRDATWTAAIPVYTPMLQKSEAFSLRVSKGEAVVNYCDPLIARRLGASDFPAG